MNLTELITSANARGHIGVRGGAKVASTVSLDLEGHTILMALDLGLIKLISAWRSTEDTNTPACRTGPVDRRVYALTHKGWDLKINCRDTLSSYKASVLAEALAAHYGELEKGPDLRYPEEAFDNWQSNTNVYTPAHQHSRGLMPNTVIDPPLVLHPDPGHEVVPDDHWTSPRRYEVLGWGTYSFAFALLLALALIGWWLS